MPLLFFIRVRCASIFWNRTDYRARNWFVRSVYHEQPLPSLRLDAGRVTAACERTLPLLRPEPRERARRATAISTCSAATSSSRASSAA